MKKEIRWKQRFKNYDKALKKLQSFAEYTKNNDEDVFEVALIGAFEFTFELAWKTLKDYLKFGGINVSIPREVIKQSFHHKLIEDGEIWISMLEDRNILSHVYDDIKAKDAVKSIETKYIAVFVQLYEFLYSKLDEDDVPCLDSQNTH